MKSLILIFVFILVSFSIFCQSESKGTIAFYNIENLFDTLDNTITRKDPDFVPEGRYQWNSQRYSKKISDMASVIAKIGDENGPEVLALAEVENKQVLTDLINDKSLKNNNYQIIHYESNDFRGIDVAMLYKSSYLKLIKSCTYKISDPENPKFITRDILLVTGLVKKDTINFIVNHWPSRRGGKEEKRALAAKNVKNIVDSLQNRNVNTKIIITGDFNDNPDNESITKHLGAKSTSKKLKKKDLFNVTAPLFKNLDGKSGTLSYKNNWFLFDQLIISKSLMNKKGIHYVKKSTKIYRSNELIYQTGPYKGFLIRTYFGKKYIGGFSDHLPVYLYLE